MCEYHILCSHVLEKFIPVKVETKGNIRTVQDSESSLLVLTSKSQGQVLKNYGVPLTHGSRSLMLDRG